MVLQFFLVGLCASLAAATCYSPNGTDRNTIYANNDGYAPCDPTAKVSMCCRINFRESPDSCTSSGLCYNPQQQWYWRESCTDPTWKDPACIKLFVNGTGMPGSGPPSSPPGDDVALTPCDNGSWCFNADNRACCRDGKGVFFVNGTQTDKDPKLATAASPSSTSPSISATSTPTSSASGSPDPASHGQTTQSDGLSTAAKAGIGAGAGAGGLFLLALFLLIWRRKVRQNHHHDKENLSGLVMYDPHQASPRSELAVEPRELATGPLSEKYAHEVGVEQVPLAEVEGDRPNGDHIRAPNPREENPNLVNNHPEGDKTYGRFA